MKLNNWWVHAILILIFLLIPILSSPDFDGSFQMLSVPMFQREMIQMVMLIAFFYLNYLVLIPKFYNKKKFFFFAFLVLLCFFTIALLPEQLIGDMKGHGAPMHFRPDSIGAPHHEGPPHDHDDDNELNMHIFRTVLPFLFAFSSSFFWYKSDEQKELERAKTKAELLNLKYQLQPHFLFNTLNSIYSLTLLKSDNAPEALLKLSNVMRYIVQESGADFVDLKKEIAYLNDYISLQLMRTDESLKFTRTEIGEPGNLKIAPLILVNFLENAFKYGFNAEKKSKINLFLMVEGNNLTFKVFNKIVNVNGESLEVGSKNTEERLEHLYPGKYQLKITETSKDYTVDLKMDLS